MSTFVAKTAQEAIEQVVWANRILSVEGMFDYLGHISIRSPENPKSFFMARALAPELVTKDDIIEMDQEGNVVTKTEMRPYTERIIHSAIYRDRLDVNSVIHCHPREVVTLSVSNVPWGVVSYQACIFYEGVPIYTAYDWTSPKSGVLLIRTKEDGDRISACLGNAMAMLLWGHGCNVAGSSVPHAIQNAIALRENTAMLLTAAQFGPVKTFSYEEAKAAARVMQSLAGAERAWHMWMHRVRKAMPDMT